MFLQPACRGHRVAVNDIEIRKRMIRRQANLPSTGYVPYRESFKIIQDRHKKDLLGVRLLNKKAYPNILVRHEGVGYQRMKVPPGKLSVHPGSYPNSGIGRPSC